MVRKCRHFNGMRSLQSGKRTGDYKLQPEQYACFALVPVPGAAAVAQQPAAEAW